MNINTNSLLTALAPKLNTTTKSVINNLSKDGKVDINSLLKNPKLQNADIKSLLNGLLKDLGSGGKTKQTVSTLLQNSKKIFDFKALGSDVKGILKHIQNEPKLQKQVAVLKQFQTDIKNLDQKTLKSNISNSGVFLESKLANKPEIKPLPYQVRVALSQIKDLQDKVDADTKNIKNIIKKLLQPATNTNTKKQTNSKTQTTNIKNPLQSTQKDGQIAQAKQITQATKTNITNIKTQNNPLLSNTQNISKTVSNGSKTILNSQQTAQNLSAQVPKTNIQATTNLSQNITTQPQAKSPEIVSTTMLKNPIINTKEIVVSLKNLVSSLQTNPKLSTQTTTLKELVVKMEVLDKNPVLSKNENTNLLKAKVLNTISTPLDEITQNTKETKNQLQSLLTQNNKNTTDGAKMAKTLLTQIQNDPKLSKETTVLKEFVTSSSTQQPQVQTQTQIQNNNIAKFQNDIKATLLQVQEQLETKGQDAPKELKAQVEKTLSQIEFYQLSSFCSQSNHTYLPFSWEDMEDGDVKFNSNKKDTFSCHIGLKLKDKGEFKAMLLLDNKNNLNINLNVENSEFKAKLQQNLQLLRQSINDIGLSLESLNVLTLQEQVQQTYEQKAYSSGQNLSFGINLKV